MFNPGETVVQMFEIPFLKSDLSKVIVTYKNKDNDVFDYLGLEVYKMDNSYHGSGKRIEGY